MRIKSSIAGQAITFIALAIACLQCHHPAGRQDDHAAVRQSSRVSSKGRDKKAILQYLSALPQKNAGRVISGQFESWGSEVRPLDDKENWLNIVYQKTGKWVGLVGAEYHNGQDVNYERPNQLFEDYWDQGGFCQLYLIMSNPAEPGSFNGGGKCDIQSVLNPDHAYNRHFFNELDKVAAGLEELRKKGVVVFLNMFAEATASWFWWGGDADDFVALYRSAHDYLVKKKGLDNLLFIFEPSCSDTTALKFYPGDDYVDMIGFSLFIDYEKELGPSSIQNYQELKKLGKPLAISQWGPRRGKDQTNAADQPPADNLKLMRGIQKYFPGIVWWMNWNYVYSICTDDQSNYNAAELLSHPWVVNRDDIALP
ncbi:MAG TPA: glycosyl hydrolase [Puia sp.]|jgi:mannan endo-1,4-beta-mannosidase